MEMEGGDDEMRDSASETVNVLGKVDQVFSAKTEESTAIKMKMNTEQDNLNGQVVLDHVSSAQTDELTINSFDISMDADYMDGILSSFLEDLRSFVAEFLKPCAPDYNKFVDALEEAARKNIILYEEKKEQVYRELTYRVYEQLGGVLPEGAVRVVFDDENKAFSDYHYYVLLKLIRNRPASYLESTPEMKKQAWGEIVKNFNEIFKRGTPFDYDSLWQRKRTAVRSAEAFRVWEANHTGEARRGKFPFLGRIAQFLLEGKLEVEEEGAAPSGNSTDDY